MDWENGNAEIHKKNSKFESFLKRTLPQELFERVRAYESCIVVSENENKTFKFVVLSDEKLYLTENPPKALQEVLHLKDVVSVDLVNEYPEFLTGEERANTQHVAIAYMTSEPRRRSFRRTKKSPRGSLTELSETRSNASTPVSYAGSLDGNVFEDSSSLSHSSISVSGSASWGSLKTGVPKKRKKPGLNDSLENGGILRSLKEEMEEDVTEDSETGKLNSMKSPVHFNRSSRNINPSTGLRSRNMQVPSATSPAAIDSIDSARKLLDNGFSDKMSVNTLPPIQGTKANFSENGKKPLTETFTKQEVDVVDIKGCCLYFRNYGRPKNQVEPSYSSSVPKLELPKLTSKVNGLPAIHLDHYVGSQLSRQNGALGSQTTLVKDSRSGTPLLGSESNMNELNNSLSDWGNTSSLTGFSLLSLAAGMERRKCVLNIYLLSLESPFLFFMKSAWNNFVIKSTLALEPEQFQISTDRTALPLNRSGRDSVERLYSRIKRDLLQPHLSLEEQYALIDQLCSDIKSNNTIKRLFWKTPDMLAFLIDQLKKYLPTSSAALNTDTGKFQRTDEIEFAILVLSAINLMLRETEVLPGRMQILKLEGGRFISDLLKILMTQPDFVSQPMRLTRHWSVPAADNRKPHADRNVDEELSRLKTEYIHMSITSMFELFLVAKQVPAEDASNLTVPGIISMFLNMKAMETFMDCLVTQIMDLINLSRFDLFTPIQALLVFQIFSLLLTFLQHSSIVVAHIRNHYYEEFKYFIQAPAVSRKLPAHYPITPVTVNLIDQVVVKVLGTPPLHSARDL
ncbi:hypothetical protein BsWGS_11180 [Bradybaena similaris]